MLYWLNLKIIPTKAYPYLDKNQSLGLLDKKVCRTKIMKIFLENMTQVMQYNVYNADNITQSFEMWPKPFMELFTSSSGSSLQIS